MTNTLTFYRKMANSNIEIMKKYKSAIINKMSYDEILNIYVLHNINFDNDIIRLQKYNNKLNIKNNGLVKTYKLQLSQNGLFFRLLNQFISTNIVYA